jgi:hypothetical protein
MLNYIKTLKTLSIREFRRKRDALESDAMRKIRIEFTAPVN